jgi:hypothetical protein
VRIVDHGKRILPTLARVAEEFGGTIGRAAVGDDHLELTDVGLPAHVPGETLDVLSLVEHRNHERDLLDARASTNLLRGSL